MYSGLQIYASKSFKTRSYVEFYLFNKRFKLYNGKSIGIQCFPNRCKSIKERDLELKKLELETHLRLKSGWIPKPISERNDTSTIKVLSQLLADVQKESYSASYKRDITDIIKSFQAFIQRTEHPALRIEQISTSQIEVYLEKYKSSGTYYMNKRRILSVVFSKLIKRGILNNNPVKDTSKKRIKSCLNEPFTQEQLPVIFSFLKAYNKNLYLCAQLMYGALLRPHQEIRNLKKCNFSKGLDFIIIDGHNNKSGQIRKIPITDFLRSTLIEHGIQNLKEDDNLFTKSHLTLNQYYFSLMWNRAKDKMQIKGLINKNNTLYSFRHSAATNLFNRHNNLHLLQRLFGHSNMIVTLTYLRGIGLDNIEDEKIMPNLKKYQ